MARSYGLLPPVNTDQKGPGPNLRSRRPNKAKVSQSSPFLHRPKRNESDKKGVPIRPLRHPDQEIRIARFKQAST